jgi:hypothetical protein
MRPQTMLSPLTGLVDAVPPDSEAARRFTLMLEGLLSDAPRFQLYRENINDTFVSWRDAGPALDALVARSPALVEAKPLVDDLSQIASMGLESLAYLSKGVAPTTEWRDSRLALLDQVAKPKAALEFAVIPGVRQLVIAAAELPHLQGMSPAEWKANVKRLAQPAVK